MKAPGAPSEKPALLALDGATEQLALALLHADGRRWTLDAPGGAQASATLIPLAQGLLRESGLGSDDLAGLAFGRGPGAFTGLRAVCAVVQGLAYGWDLPVLSLDSLALVAEAAAQQDADWRAGWVVMDARMGELYAAPYALIDGAWQALAEPALWTPMGLDALWRSSGAPEALAGSGLDLLPPGWRAVRQAPADLSRAAGLAGLARQAWARADWQDAVAALPHYVRDKVALTTAERQAGARMP